MSNPLDISFQELLNALRDEHTPLNARYLYRLSDLEGSELEELNNIWKSLPLWRRQALMEDIEELSARDTLLSFVSLGCLASNDQDPKVRLLAIRTLWEYEDQELVSLYLRLLEQDEDLEVRATAAGALGQYIYAGELDKIPLSTKQKVEEHLMTVVNSDESPRVCRSALESLGYSGREQVNALIETAYHSDDKDWLASALFAMGRSANKDWQPHIMAELESRYPVVRTEAARAAGELEIHDALPALLELLDDPDDNTRLASIWSLSQIGGEGVREILEQLFEEAEGKQESELLELAIENLLFNEGFQEFMPLFDFPEDDDTLDNVLNMDDYN